MVQSGGFLGRCLGQLLKTGLPLMRNLLTPLAKHVSITLRLTVVTSETNAAKNILRSGMATLTVSNEEMADITKIVKYREECG